MGGNLSFQSSGLLFPRLTDQHPLTRLAHAIELRVFNEAHQGLSRCWPKPTIGSPRWEVSGMASGESRRVVRGSVFSIRLSVLRKYL
jgi:hypothetical protein